MTLIQKFGIENISQLAETQEKIKQTHINKYGMNYNATVEYKEKLKTKFGVENIWQLISTKQTNIKNLGFDHVMKSPKIQQKRINSTYKKMFYSLHNSNRLKNLVTPMFTEAEYLLKQNKYEKFSWKCNSCGNKFSYSITNGFIPRCPVCFPLMYSSSKLEKEVTEYVKSIGLEIEENDRSIISPLELDIYIPSHKLAIEFNGIYWHSKEIGCDKWYHQYKTEKCDRINIRLIHIYEHEWKYSEAING